MKPAPDFAREPWKHPVAWKGHLVRRTRDYPAGVTVSVATCECRWTVCAKVAPGGGGEGALQSAIEDHWRGVIAEAEAVPAS